MWMDTSDESEFLSQVCIPTFFRSHRMSRVSDFPIHKAGQGPLGCLPVGPPKSRRSDMCQHLQHVKDMTFKRRLRISGVLCSLGIFFVAGLGHNFQIEKKNEIAFLICFGSFLRTCPCKKKCFCVICDEPKVMSGVGVVVGTMSSVNAVIGLLTQEGCCRPCQYSEPMCMLCA